MERPQTQPSSRHLWKALLAISLIAGLGACQKNESKINETAKTESAGETKPSPEKEAADKVTQEELSTIKTAALNKLKDTVVICTVNGDPITVGQFKKDYREAVSSLQALLSLQPEQVPQFLGQARALGVTLSEEEKKRIIESASKPTALEGKTLDQFLKEKKLTKAQFDAQVLTLGLAFKTGSRIIEAQLLNELVGRDLLLAAAKQEGFYRAAFKKFETVKETPKFKNYLKVSEHSADEVKEDFIEDIMLNMMVEKIAKDNPLDDKVLRNFYDKNKKAFDHGERIRVSHIVIAAPQIDSPPLESIKTQLKKQNPKMTDTELNAEVEIVKQQKLASANEIIEKAKKEDFAKLANEYTEDMGARNAKNGGDIGYLEVQTAASKDQKAIVDAVAKLKPGEVAPQPVQTVFGYHIVKLTDRQPAGAATFDSVKDQLRAMLEPQSKDIAKLKWLEQKRADAKIVISEDFKKEAKAATAEINAEESKAMASQTKAATKETAKETAKESAKETVR